MCPRTSYVRFPTEAGLFASVSHPCPNRLRTSSIRPGTVPGLSASVPHPKLIQIRPIPVRSGEIRQPSPICRPNMRFSGQCRLFPPAPLAVHPKFFRFPSKHVRIPYVPGPFPYVSHPMRVSLRPFPVRRSCVSERCASVVCKSAICILDSECASGHMA